MNRLELIAELVERDALRYTPAGIPVVSARLTHESVQVEAGVARQVQLEMAVLAAGEIAGQLNGAELGKPYRLTGFIARKNRNSKALVFHLSEIKADTEDH